MNRFLRILGWSLLGLGILSVGVLATAWFVDLRQTDQELADEFKGQPIRPTVHYYQVGRTHRTIRFIETPARSGDAILPVVLFVHGAPSSLSFFNEFFKDTALLNRAAREAW